MSRGCESFAALRKKCPTAARFTDDKSFKPFQRSRSAGSKTNLRSNCRERYGAVVKQEVFPAVKTKIFRLHPKEEESLGDLKLGSVS